MRDLALAAALLLVGCDDSGGTDAGPAVDAGGAGMDAGVTDAGVTDAGVTDAGMADAGMADAGMTDAGMTDAGMADAGMTDAGMADAGAPDAGAPDAGAPDAGAPDAGMATCTPSVPMSNPMYSRYEGIGVNNSCVTGADCMRSGCSAEVCAAEPVFTTCEVVPIPAGTCQCSAGTCIWATGTCTP